MYFNRRLGHLKNLQRKTASEHQLKQSPKIGEHLFLYIVLQSRKKKKSMRRSQEQIEAIQYSTGNQTSATNKTVETKRIISFRDQK